MSAAWRDPFPVVPFEIVVFAATLSALGLTLETTITVRIVIFIQMKKFSETKLILNHGLKRRLKIEFNITN